MDKYDRLGEEGVFDLLQSGRKDESGDFTQGAGLSLDGARRVLKFMKVSTLGDREEVLKKLYELFGLSQKGQEACRELKTINDILTSTGFGPDRVSFDTSIVRGLGYYTCLLYTSPSPRDGLLSRMPSSA